MRSGDLLVEVCSKKQAQQIIKLKALANIPVTVNSHTSLNYSKGVITCGELFNVPLEEITMELKPQGVTHVRQINIRRDGQLLPTKHYILTFHSPKLPEFLYAGYIKLPGHDSQQCCAPEKCVNCGGNHTSYSRNCERWQLEKQITSIKIKENLSYPEARKKVLAQTPTTGLTYASVVKKPFCANCSCSNCAKYTTQNKTTDKSSDSDTDTVVKPTTPENIKPVRSKSNTKSKNSLKLKLAKRGLTSTQLHSKMKLTKTQNSVALGLATKGIVQKDLTSIFGDTFKCPDTIALHPSEGDDEELDMSCDTPSTQTTSLKLSPITKIS
ncbi:uncharacterized protein LOC129971936 [Argiope bruennichi]|uniref:uncharacterized protein LOC129971936 n=1 Tax=Argiope bruennichi TaxID=94029 RepID=UPI0024950A70|nr:uncharacterized protein LOC129971936 [Argiope bruennichi]